MQVWNFKCIRELFRFKNKILCHTLFFFLNLIYSIVSLGHWQARTMLIWRREDLTDRSHWLLMWCDHSRCKYSYKCWGGFFRGVLVDLFFILGRKFCASVGNCTFTRIYGHGRIAKNCLLEFSLYYYIAFQCSFCLCLVRDRSPCPRRDTSCFP